MDCLLPIGRGQRQLILGDRGTGKMTIVLSTLIYNNRINYLSSVDGFGSKRLFGFYVGLNQNLSKIYQLSILSVIDWRANIVLSTNSSSTAYLTFSLPQLAISFGEYYRDRGYDIILCYDDLIKHAKSYRQLSLIIGSMPARQSFPANIFNIHSSILERFSRMFSKSDRGSISCLPILETINSDISEYISTNVISITDGQLFLNKSLFHLSIRPSIDSSLSVSRIGSSAQCALISYLSAGLKNALTTSRQSLSLAHSSSLHSASLSQPVSHPYNSIHSFLCHFSYSSLNSIFYQHPAFISSIESSISCLFFIDFIYCRLFTFIPYHHQLSAHFWFGLIMLDWIVAMPNRLIILNVLHSLTDHDLLLALYYYLLYYYHLHLYLVSINQNNINMKTFWVCSYLLIG